MLLLYIRKYRKAGTILWINKQQSDLKILNNQYGSGGIWEDLPVKARIIEIKSKNGVEYANVNCIRDEESYAVGSQGILFEKLFPSKERLLENIAQKEQARISEIKAKIQTKEDCIMYLYNHHVANGTEYTDWTARQAIKEIAQERWGLELK